MDAAVVELKMVLAGERELHEGPVELGVPKKPSVFGWFYKALFSKTGSHMGLY